MIDFKSYCKGGKNYEKMLEIERKVKNEMTIKLSKKVKKEWKKVEDSVLVDWEKRKQNPVEGKLIAVIIAKSKEKGVDKHYKIFKVETEKEGVLAFSGSQLEQKLISVKVGDEMKVIYSGKVKTSSGFKVNTFDVWIR